MFDNRYDEQGFAADSRSYEAAELDREHRDMQDIELEGESDLERARRRAPATERKCCDDPMGFTRVSSLDRDPDTGYFTGDFYRYGTCGSRICEEDYAAIIAWAAWAPIDELTAGPVLPDVDATPVAIPPGRQAPVSPRKVA